MTHADYADYLKLHENISAQTESLLNGLEQAAKGIGLYMKTEQSLRF